MFDRVIYFGCAMSFGRKQKPKRDPKRKKYLQKNKWTVFLFVWMFITIYWFLIAVGEFPDEYISDWSNEYSTISNYPAFLEEHSISPNLLVNPLFVLCASMGISVVIIVMTGRLWLIIILVPMIPCAFSFWGLIGLSWTTQLYHVDTIDYVDHIYHLTYGEDSGDMLDEKYLVLFTCDGNGEICSSRVIVDYQYASRDSRFMIDYQTPQVQVVSDNQIVFTLEDD